MPCPITTTFHTFVGDATSAADGVDNDVDDSSAKWTAHCWRTAEANAPPGPSGFTNDDDDDDDDDDNDDDDDDDDDDDMSRRWMPQRCWPSMSMSLPSGKRWWCSELRNEKERRSRKKDRERKKEQCRNDVKINKWIRNKENN